MNIPDFLSISSCSALPRRQLVAACLERAARSESVFTKLYPAAARAAADCADAMRAAAVSVSPLAGMPVSIKDLLDVAGETTLAGSVVLKDAAPATADAPVVARLRRAGAAIVGKTNMTEFAFSGVGLNPHHGTPANPADARTARIPGGSSSGAAVAVAAGICVAAIGSDTGGSIRIPAALCGIVGFKSTARRVPTAGALPLSTTLDTICAMARTVDDCIAVDAVLADAPLEIPKLPLAGLRLAAPDTVVLDDMEPHVAACFADALGVLSAAGAKLVELPLPPFAQAAALNRFSAVEAFAWHRELLAQREADYDFRVAKRIKLGASMTAADYIELHRARRAWIADLERRLAPFDAMLMPTVPIVAPPIAELEASEEAFFKANGLLLRNTSLINLLDGCGLSLPCHPAGTLPVGLMIAGPANADARILGVARAVEQALRRA